MSEPHHSAVLSGTLRRAARTGRFLRAWSVRHPLPAGLLLTTTLLLLGIAGQRAIGLPQGLLVRYQPNARWRGKGRTIPVRGISSAILARMWDGTPPQDFSAIWQGVVVAPDAGLYTFATRSDDGSQVYIDGLLVVDNAGRHSARLAQGTIQLNPGSHALTVRYFQEGGEYQLDFLWARAGRPLTPVPASALRQRPGSVQRLDAAVLFDRIVVALKWLWFAMLLLSAAVALAPAVAALRRWLGRRGAWPALGWILAGAFVLDAVGLWWGLPDRWAVDELVPSAVIGGIQHHFSHGWFSPYPPLHFYVLTLAFTPVLLLQWLGLANIYGGGYVAMFAIGRSVSVVMALGTLVAVFCSGEQLFGRRAGLLAAAALAPGAVFVYYAKTANPDMPFVFWFALSLVFYLRVLRERRLFDHVLLGLFAALAVCAKDQAYGLYLLMPLPILYEAWRANRRAGRAHGLRDAVLDRRLVAAMATVVAAFALCHNLLFNWHGFVSHVREILGPASQPYRLYQPTFVGRVMLLRTSVGELAVAVGWPILLTGVAGAVYTAVDRAYRRTLVWLAVPVLSYYLTFISIVLHTFDRFMLPVAVILALLAGHALDRLLAAPAARWRFWRTAAVAGVFAYSLLYGATVDVLMVRDARYQVEAWLRTRRAANDLIGFAGLPEYLPRMDKDVGVRVKSIPALERVRPKYYVLNADYARFYPPDTPSGRLIAGLRRGTLGYRLVLRARAPSPWPWLPGADPDLVGARRESLVLSNLNKINPTIEVFERETDPLP